MTKTTWHYIEPERHSAAYNMALDEALLRWNSEGTIGSILRFYQWERPTLSIGYFQQLARDIDAQAVADQGVELVRRPTGGRGVLHDDELTYSVIINEDYPGIPETVTESYRVISEGVLQGFRNLGLDAQFAVPDQEKMQAQLKQPKTGICFDMPSWYELVVEGRKVAGSAQTRQQGVILQHGAILLSLDVERYISLFRYPSERVKERMRQSLPRRAVFIADLSAEEVSFARCVEAFRSGFEQALDIALVPFTLSAEQQREVEQLAADKYASRAWTEKK